MVKVSVTKRSNSNEGILQMLQTNKGSLRTMPSRRGAQSRGPKLMVSPRMILGLILTFIILFYLMVVMRLATNHRPLSMNEIGAPVPPARDRLSLGGLKHGGMQLQKPNFLSKDGQKMIDGFHDRWKFHQKGKDEVGTQSIADRLRKDAWKNVPQDSSLNSVQQKSQQNKDVDNKQQKSSGHKFLVHFDEDALIENARSAEVTTGSNAIPKDAIKRRGYKPPPHGHNVDPQVLVQHPDADVENDDQQNEDGDGAKVGHSTNIQVEVKEKHPNPDYILKAYAEKIDFKTWWNEKPLPNRETAKARELAMYEYPQVNSCARLIQEWPTQEHNFPGVQDTFLPWIHDVFPTHDGKYIQFVAQNRRRCHTGHTHDELRILAYNNPQASLFQHVPIKRVKNETDGTTRYKLTNHANADQDAVATRFICRFKPSMQETFSVFNFDYDWTTYRKKYRYSFDAFDGGIKSIHTSQLLFKCPVPEELQSAVKNGSTIINDFASLFVDLIPIRTPPRYGKAQRFLPPYFKNSVRHDQKIDPNDPSDGFDPLVEWGNGHVLPNIEDSGRWENIPICKTSLETYSKNDKTHRFEKQEEEQQLKTKDTQESVTAIEDQPVKKHRLVACVWASAGYATRGNRFAINDGQRRLIEWITMNKITGFDHFYIYDNSMAFADDPSETNNPNVPSLKPVTDLLGPDLTTYINWPARICNNNPNNVDSPGERSSQYAAESSCRLRFGPHVHWIGQFDIDEYLIPMGNYNSISQLLDKLDQENTKIISFGSWRAWPRRDLIEPPVRIDDRTVCGHPHMKVSCFDLKVPLNKTMLQTYNCDRQSLAEPNKNKMPAEKQLYRPDYVKQHFIHYSAVTKLSDMNETDWHKYSKENRHFFHRKAMTFHARAFPDPMSRFADEINEATMLHTKAIATQDTADWLNACMPNYEGDFTCRIGVPHEFIIENPNDMVDEKGWQRNCFVNPKVEHYWVPKLEKALQENHGHIFDIN